MARTVGILAVVLVLSSLSLAGTVAHVSGTDSVTSGQLAIRDFTQFDTERMHAIGQWNGLNPVWVYAWYPGQPIDLVMEDYNNCGHVANAVYVPADDEIKFNLCYMLGNPPDTPNERKKTATHEVGHALGLAHSFYGQVMYGVESETIYLQNHDVCSYNVVWLGWSPSQCGD